MQTFAATLAEHGLELRRGATRHLQVNLGLRCNQRCAHCRLDAGPERSERMSDEVVDEVIAFVARAGLASVDLTGGAPELHEGLPSIVARLAPLVPRVVLRSNLTALGGRPSLLPTLVAHRVAIAASFPSLDEMEHDFQRGDGTWAAGLGALRLLNEAGYGVAEGLELTLVTSPTAAALPAPEAETERRFRAGLARRDVAFTRLSSFVNLPLGRFAAWLDATGQRPGYQVRLAAAFNPRTVPSLMCRDTMAVDWRGLAFDCDFNLPTGLHLGGRPTRLADLDGAPPAGSPIAVGDHCYACTAGAGFT